MYPRRSVSRRMLEELEEGFTRPVARRPRSRSGAWMLVRRAALGGVACLALVILVAGGSLGLLLHRHAHPARELSSETPDALFTSYEDVSFTSSDGVPLSGWWIPGGQGLPVLILCHDLGRSKASMLGMAARLSGERYPIFLFDFRGHGGSGGASSFGTLEKRDLLGAIDWVESRPGRGGSRLGIFGVGMGAYAAILAAAERPHARCLVLDTPYRDAYEQFAVSNMPAGMLRKVVARGSMLLYDTVYRVSSADESAARRVAELSDRDLLLLAPRNEPIAAESAQGMYDSISEARHNYKNLELLPATATGALYGKDREQYDAEMTRFFRSYLPTGAPVSGSTPASPPRRASRR